MSYLSPESVQQLLAEDALIIDVRTPDEFSEGQVPGAINIPLDTLAGVLPRHAPEKSKPLLLHCLSGARSGRACLQLLDMGYTNVHNLGSFSRAWQMVSRS